MLDFFQDIVLEVRGIVAKKRGKRKKGRSAKIGLFFPKAQRELCSFLESCIFLLAAFR